LLNMLRIHRDLLCDVAVPALLAAPVEFLALLQHGQGCTRERFALQ